MDSATIKWLYPQDHPNDPMSPQAVLGNNTTTEDKSLFIRLFQDPHFTHTVDEVWLLELAVRRYQSPPRGDLPQYPGPRGRTASVVLVCLERLPTSPTHFRRIGLAEAHEVPEW